MTLPYIEDEEIVVTKDELNVLQYVGGVVSHSLLKRFASDMLSSWSVWVIWQ